MLFRSVVEEQQELPKPQISEVQQSQISTNNYGFLVVIVGAIAIGILLYVKKSNSKKTTK